MCSTKSVVAGQGGPSPTLPSCRATTRAAAFSLVHGTSVNDSRPNELHSSIARNTTPYPEARVGAGVGSCRPAAPRSRTTAGIP